MITELIREYPIRELIREYPIRMGIVIGIFFCLLIEIGGYLL
jgi:uncharacterized membrane protein